MNQATLAHWLAEQTWSHFAQSLATYYSRHGQLTERQLDSAMRMYNKVSSKSANRSSARHDLEVGYYHNSEEYYCVILGKTGNTYAKRWTGTGWTYDGKRSFAFLTSEHKMTLDEAKAFGHLHGRCLVCGRTLTNPASVEAGIGPVCASRF